MPIDSRPGTNQQINSWVNQTAQAMPALHGQAGQPPPQAAPGVRLTEAQLIAAAQARQAVAPAPIPTVYGQQKAVGEIPAVQPLSSAQPQMQPQQQPTTSPILQMQQPTTSAFGQPQAPPPAMPQTGFAAPPRPFSQPAAPFNSQYQQRQRPRWPGAQGG